MSTAVVPSGGTSDSNAFAQQGTVDWTTLSRSTVNFTVEILARLSKAGVEPITAAMGQAIFSGFNLDPEGQKRFSDTISRLKAFSSYGEIMWFGFGVKHIVRTLSETEQGATCAAICACLSVSYDKFFCSKVLKALADQQKAPNTLMPSISQWVALVNICSGTVLGSRFPHLVEGYSRLMQSYVGFTKYVPREATSADALARAILELAKVSSGTTRSVTFIGGIDCGWLAALAQWLLSLRVDVVAADGSILFSSKTSADPSYYPQITIVTQLGQTSQCNTTILKQSLFVQPGSLFFGIKKRIANNQRHYFSVGRSEWSTILHDTFGEKLDALLHPELIQGFAELLCCGFSASDSSTGQHHPNPWGNSSATSTETRLSQLSFTAQRLPELAPVCQIAKQKVFCQEKSYDSNFPRVFIHHCSCDKCLVTRLGGRIPHRISPVKSKDICLEKAALAIFEYAWTLSWLDIDEGIYPSASGLQLIYSRQEPERSGDILTSAIKDRPFRKSLISTAIELFTGHLVRGNYQDGLTSAACEGGVCAYLPSLQNPTTSPQEQLRVVVVAGHIEWNGKMFSQARDGTDERGEGLVDDLASTFIQAYGPNAKLRLIVEETFTSDVLEASLSVSSELVEPLQGITYHSGHIVDPLAASEALNPRPAFGASKIRSAIIFCRLSSNCHSEPVDMNATSRTGPIPWTGTCSEAAKYLWGDGYNNQRDNRPTGQEWVLISQSQCCQEIVRGPYQLLYSVICRLKGKSKVRLSSADCLMCLLGTHRNLPSVDHLMAVVGRGHPHQNHGHRRWAHTHVRNLECVIVHSFLSSSPSSRELFTSLEFPSKIQSIQSKPTSSMTKDIVVSEIAQDTNPNALFTPQTEQPASKPEQTITDNSRPSDSSILPNQATPALTQLPTRPPGLGNATTDIGKEESDSSAASSQAIKRGIPDRGRVFENSNPSARLRARSL